MEQQRLVLIDRGWLEDALEEKVIAVLSAQLGHHLDALFNASDIPGDEGELFLECLRGDPLRPSSSTAPPARAAASPSRYRRLRPGRSPSMHELALAEGVVATALENAAGRQVRRIVVAVGELQQIEERDEEHWPSTWFRSVLGVGSRSSDS